MKETKKWKSATSKKTNKQLGHLMNKQQPTPRESTIIIKFNVPK